MDGYIGEIRRFASNYAPINWCLCDGSTLSQGDYPDLYTLMDSPDPFSAPNLNEGLDSNVYILCCQGSSAKEIGGMEGTIGEIRQFIGTFVPGNWMPCDGRILDISTYLALFSITGNTFGGNGYSTFALPNQNSALPDGTPQYIICVNGYFPPRC